MAQDRSRSAIDAETPSLIRALVPFLSKHYAKQIFIFLYEQSQYVKKISVALSECMPREGQHDKSHIFVA